MAEQRQQGVLHHLLLLIEIQRLEEVVQDNLLTPIADHLLQLDRQRQLEEVHLLQPIQEAGLRLPITILVTVDAQVAAVIVIVLVIVLFFSSF